MIYVIMRTRQTGGRNKNKVVCSISFERKGNVWVSVFVFNATFNNMSVISGRSVLLVEETGVSGENHRPAACH